MRPAIASHESPPLSQNVGDSILHAIEILHNDPCRRESERPTPLCIVVRIRYTESPGGNPSPLAGQRKEDAMKAWIDENVGHLIVFACIVAIGFWMLIYLDIIHDGIIENRKEIIHTREVLQNELR